MDLSDIRTEVLNKGFDPIYFGSTRINQFINDGYQLVARRTEYYTDETSYDFSTVVGTVKYALPTNFARVRDLWDTSRTINMLPVGLRDLDQSYSPNQGPPIYYALDGANVHLFPTPDNVYPLELRYWCLPNALVNDSDVPTLPSDWHRILVYWACKECYAAEDDPNMSQYWEQQFNNTLAEFQADAKFPSTDYPTVAKSMWDADAPLQQKGWSLWSWW